MARSDLPARLGVAVVGIPAALALVYLGSWPLAVALAALAAVGAHEFYGMAGRVGGRPFSAAGMGVTALLVLGAAWRPDLERYALLVAAAVVLLTLGSLAAAVWRRWPEGRPFSAVSTTVTGAVYVGATLGFALLLRHHPTPSGAPPSALSGAALVFFPIAVTWIGDSSAYFGGRALGKRRLIPAVSPGKTVAGAVASVIGCVVASALYVTFVLSAEPRPGLTLGWAVVAGVALSAVAQVGDLVASVLKRESGVKDSGRLFPGHGGALDRLDALLYTIPLAYVMVVLAEVLA